MPLLSPIRVEEMTPDRLVIVDPPYYAFGLVFLLLGLGVLVAGFVKRAPGASLINWRAIAIAAPFLLVALIQLTGHATIAFSRATGNMTLEQRYAGIALEARQIPLREIVQADVAMVEANRSLYITLRSGETVTLTGNSDRTGHNAAATAINSFLASRSLE